MEILNRITIKQRFFLAFIFIISLFFVFTMFSLSEMRKLGELTATLYNHPLRVSNRSLRASMGVIKMHRSMKDVALAESELELQNAIAMVRDEERRVYEHLDVVKTCILGTEGKILENETREMFAKWKAIRDQVIILAMKGETSAAAQITKRKGADYVAMLEHKMFELTSYARGKADEFMGDAELAQTRKLRETGLFISAVVLISCGIAYLIMSGILKSVSSLENTMAEITDTGELKRSEMRGNHEIAKMAGHFNRLIERLENQFWIRDGLNRLNRELSGDLSYQELVTKSIRFLSKHMGACAGALYDFDDKSSVCELKASYAFVERKHLGNRFEKGEGIVGQVAVEKTPILLKNISPEDALSQTGTVSEPPKSIYAVPLVHESRFHGVLEIASFEHIGALQTEFLDAASDIVAGVIHTVRQNEKIQTLYTETRNANETLETRTKEVDAANERLTALNRQLQAQSEELQAQTQELHAQKSELEMQRIQVEEADRLKSEFLSNMSHELRTPLNSILALSQLMISKGTGNDTEQEGEYLKVIERNGRHLLSLINDILDLSKIEAGRMELNLSEFHPARTIGKAGETILPITAEKGLNVGIHVDETLVVFSDEEKFHQIVLNLLSNAAKFTEKGEIKVTGRKGDGRLSFDFRDTGIGIPENELPQIFDEFRQVDGSTTRIHGGTGLGLAICRKLARLLDGDIKVVSEPGRGSVFTLTLPVRLSDNTASELKSGAEIGAGKPFSRPDSETAAVSDNNGQTILVIEDEESVRSLIGDYLTQSGYRVIMAENGFEGIALAKTRMPFAITLDILMPDMDGWEVLKKLKSDRKTAKIPVIVVSVSDDRETGMALGAVGYVLKPVARNLLLAEMEKLASVQTVHRILAVDDDKIVLKHIEMILSDAGYWVECATGGKEGIAKAIADPPDAMILDLMMPEIDGFSVLDKIRAEPATHNLPVVILTAKDLTSADIGKLSGAVRRIIEKKEIDKNTLLQKIENAIREIENSDSPDPGEKPMILIVEDNDVAALQIRSVLEENGFAAAVAPGGREAVEFISQLLPDGVILDLMMPDVDGFQVLESIREKAELCKIPILVLSAKELTEAEREKLTEKDVYRFIRKGEMNREQILGAVRKMMAKPVHRETAEPPAPALERTILVVEDNPDNLLTIGAILDNAGYAYVSASDGAGALDRAREIRPGLVLMDVQLPGMSGLEATRMIKSDRNLYKTPVIAVTAKAMQGDRGNILAAGCDDYLSKPVGPSELVAKLKKWMG